MPDDHRVCSTGYLARYLPDLVPPPDPLGAHEEYAVGGQWDWDWVCPLESRHEAADGG